MSNLINRKGKENSILRKHAKICTTGHFDHMAAGCSGMFPVPCHHPLPQKWMPTSAWWAQSVAHCTGKSYEGGKIIFFYTIFKQQPLWNQMAATSSQRTQTPLCEVAATDKMGCFRLPAASLQLPGKHSQESTAKWMAAADKWIRVSHTLPVVLYNQGRQGSMPLGFVRLSRSNPYETFLGTEGCYSVRREEQDASSPSSKIVAS